MGFLSIHGYWIDRDLAWLEPPGFQRRPTFEEILTNPYFPLFGHPRVCWGLSRSGHRPTSPLPQNSITFPFGFQWKMFRSPIEFPALWATRFGLIQFPRCRNTREGWSGERGEARVWWLEAITSPPVRLTFITRFTRVSYPSVSVRGIVVISLNLISYCIWC